MVSRSTVDETTGCTPSEMMFGHGSRVLSHLLYGRPEPDENSRDVTSDADKVRERLAIEHRFAPEYLGDREWLPEAGL